MQFRNAPHVLLCSFVVAGLAVAATAEAQNGPYQMADDHFTCYKAKINKNLPKFPKGTQAVLADGWENSTQDVKKRGHLCLPVDVDQAGIADPLTPLGGLKIKTAKGEAKHTRRTNVRVFTAFADLSLDTKKEAVLLTPGANGNTAPVFADHGVDNLKCYKAKISKGTTKFPKGVQVTLDDAFENLRTFDLKGPKLVCLAADRDGDAVKNADGNLLCLKAKVAKGEAKHTRRTMENLADAYGFTRMDTKKEDLLCVPALVDPPAAFCGDGVVNQASEECDVSGAECMGGAGVCGGDCLCTACGNGVIDAGEVCDSSVGCDAATETCNACQACDAIAPLGQRTMSLSNNSGFFTSFIPGSPVGQPTGTLTLEGGITNPATGETDVSLAAGGFQYVRVNIPLGGTTVCYRFESCTGTLYCNGGTGVDVLIEQDSLAAGACLQDGTGPYVGNECTAAAGNVCCSNACEGVGVGSGNAAVTTVGGGTGGEGALLLSCSVRTQDAALGSDCLAVDYSGTSVAVNLLTTGTTTRILNHCPGSSSPPDVVPEFAKTGENFSCLQWSAEDGPGSLTLGIPTEEPSSLITGDGSQAMVLTD